MACPHVSGLAALLISQNPNLTNVQVENTIEDTAEDISPPGKDSFTGSGIISVYRAMLGKVSGIVTNSLDGSPVEETLVEAIDQGQIVASTLSLPDGSYLLEDMEPGLYDIKASAAGFSSNTRNDVLVESAAETQSIDFALMSYGSISGVVVQHGNNKPVRKAKVEAVQANVVLGTTTTGSDGSYIIESLEGGVYDVCATASSFETGFQSGIVVSPGQDTPNVDFVLNKKPGSGKKPKRK